MARVMAGRPAPTMAWPSWAARPWLGEAAASSPRSDDPSLRDKWRRLDDRARPQPYAYVVKADDQMRALAKAKASVLLGEPDVDEGAVDSDPPELLEVERLLDEPSPAVTAERPTSFAAYAAAKVAPTFLPGRRRRDDDNFGVDSDVLDAVEGIDAALHGKLRRFVFNHKKREHVALVSSALLCANGQLRVFRDCACVVRIRLCPRKTRTGRVVLPSCWFDDEPRDVTIPSLPRQFRMKKSADKSEDGVPAKDEPLLDYYAALALRPLEKRASVASNTLV